MNQIQIAAKMYEARDAMRFLWKETYPSEIAKYQEFIKAQMAKADADALHATMELMQKLQSKFPDSGVTQAMILAACVEMIEPSV